MDVVCTGDDQSATGHPIAPTHPTGCGRTFDGSGEWDVAFDSEGLMSEHRDALCPDCGTRTFVVRV
jgi:DNA-directed RNA polymerase subunit RPC12/RpoP